MFTETTQSQILAHESLDLFGRDDNTTREISAHYELIKAYIGDIDQLLADRPEQITATLSSRTNAWSSSEHKAIMTKKIVMYLQESGYESREVKVYDALPSGKHGQSASEEAERVYISAERL